MYALMRDGALASVRVGRLRRLRYDDLVAYVASLTAERRTGARSLLRREVQMSRRPNGASSIYKGSGRLLARSHHGRNSRRRPAPDRRHVKGKTEAAVTKKVRQLERERDWARRAGR